MAPRQTSDQQLSALGNCIIRIAKQRDKNALAELFDHYAPLIRAFSLARDPGADLIADDLTQEVMIRIWLKAGSYNPRLANLNTWVFTLARNCRIDYLRRNGRFNSAIDPTYIYEDLEDETADPFQLVHQNHLQKTIGAALDQLPLQQSQILKKVYLEGKSHQQTSDDLNLPLGTVKSRVRLALKKLKVLVVR
jgi:RNA polymerase sigma factor (sigma-70 family)